jgi:glycosyltransferase involved in cell wall biosynthesis
MQITAIFHLFPPEHCAVSETTVHAALRAMGNRGHKVKVLCANSRKAPYTIDGIDVSRPPRRGLDTWLDHFVEGSDLLITHLDLTSQAMQLAMRVKVPLVHFVHNDSQLMCWRVDARVPYKNALTIYNSNWLAAKPSHWNGQEMPDEWRAPSIIVHPVVEPECYRCETGSKITLVNPSPTKGAGMFKALALQMPHREFLAVEGGYGEQAVTAPGTHPRTAAIGNIEWMAHTPDIREVFRKTKVLLMPSDYESYGRVGIEAACCGIPTVAHPTEGLKEAFGEAGIFIDRNDVAAWYAEVERLMSDDLYYKQCSNAVLALANSLNPESEFDRLEIALLETIERSGNKEGKPMKTWTSNGWIWRMQDGSFKKMDDQRIPAGASSLFAGRGTQVPEEVAIKHGWVGPDLQPEPEAKAMEAPQENKAIEAPQENKARTRKKRVA